MQEITIQAVCPETRERPLARLYRPAEGGIPRQDFRDEENLVAPPGERRADQFLGCARAIKRRSVDMGQAEIETPP